MSRRPISQLASVFAAALLAALPLPAATPVAVADTLFVTGQRQAIDVLSNDRETDGVPLTVTEATTGTCTGTVSVVNNLVIHQPNPTGIDHPCSFTYTVKGEGAGTATTTVTLQASPAIFRDGFETNGTDSWSSCVGQGC